ncbi:hypothetical protein T01_2918 [Trichinella spiralis]|uniref:Uncharacterized protein n=1 Tax=Trichinella spiralis TaxID=6334 RepID=A0A0V1BNL3_TRISP|nr:hypothetical protein T01_2918 [Trichinella spiralis]
MECCGNTSNFPVTNGANADVTRYARVLLRTSCYGGKITEYEGDILQYSVKVSGSQSGRYRPLGVDGTL